MPKNKPPVKRNDELILNITAMGAEGQGIGRAEGFTVFVPGALPDETVRAHVIKVYPSYAVAKLAEITVPSAARVQPRCPQFAHCGGCLLQHMDYPSQLEYKHRTVADAIARIGGFTGLDVNPIIGMEDPWRYRNKGSFPFGQTDGAVCFGFFAQRSHRITPLTDCCIQDDALLRVPNTVCAWANEYGVTPYDESTGTGTLRHVVARKSTSGDIMAALVTTGALPHISQLTGALKREVPGLISVVHNLNSQNTNVIFGDEFDTVWGQGYIEQSICGLDYRVSAASFLQVNIPQTVRLYETAVELLSPGKEETVFDLYCGIGTISLLLAQSAGRVIGVESVEQAVQDAKVNCELNGVSNAAFVCGNAEDVLPELLLQHELPDAIVVDPPRKGCDYLALRAMIECSANRIAYISCNPATLARDCKLLAEGGFIPVAVQPVDMFPQTAHVETVVLMSRVEK